MVDLFVKIVKYISKNIKPIFRFKLIAFIFYKDNNPCNSSPCLNGGGCIANPNTCSYSCQCPTGFTGPCCATRKE